MKTLHTALPLLLTSIAGLAACSSPTNQLAPETTGRCGYVLAPVNTEAAKPRPPIPIGSPVQSYVWFSQVLQGMQSYTLVAGKSFAVRAYFPDAATASSVASAQMIISGPDGESHVVETTSPVQIPTSTLGPSVVVTAAGSNVPYVGQYFIATRFFDANGVLVHEFDNDYTQLLPTKDLRFLVDRIWSGSAAAKPGEIQAAIDAVMRMSQIMPVRDGVGTLGPGLKTQGIRYTLHNNPQPQDADLPSVFTAALNPPPGSEAPDLALTYRFQNPGENAGGDAVAPLDGIPLPWGIAVWGTPSLPQIGEVFAHETGHNLGLVPTTSPDSDGQVHSKYETIQGDDALLGFDVAYDHVWEDPLHDLMFWEGNGDDNDGFALNQWDWEIERQSLLALPSTGPMPPNEMNGVLQGTRWQGTVRIGLNADGRQEFFAVGTDAALYHSWETVRGAASTSDLSGWAPLGGSALPGSVRVVSDAAGSMVVFERQPDRRIYFVAQDSPNGGWSTGWQQLSTMTTLGYDVGVNLDGRLEVQSIGDDGALHTTWQLTPNGAFSAPASLGGWGLAGEVAIARNADGRLQTFAVGGDGNVYSLWEPAPNRGPWTAWTSVSDAVMAHASRLHVVPSGDGRLNLIAMRTDGSVAWSEQAAPGGGFGAATVLGGGFEPDFTATATADGRLHVFALGSDGSLQQAFQPDANRPAVWSNFVTESISAFNAGIAALPYASTGGVSVVGVEDDGQLLWGVW